MPRFLMASWNRGSDCTAASHSMNSSNITLGCTPGMCSHETSRSSSRETTASYVAETSLSSTTRKASRRTGSPGRKPRTTCFSGSRRTTVSNRVLVAKSRSFFRIDVAFEISPLVSGSNGWETSDRLGACDCCLADIVITTSSWWIHVGCIRSGYRTLTVRCRHGQGKRRTSHFHIPIIRPESPISTCDSGRYHSMRQASGLTRHPISFALQATCDSRATFSHHIWRVVCLNATLTPIKTLKT